MAQGMARNNVGKALSFLLRGIHVPGLKSLRGMIVSACWASSGCRRDHEWELQKFLQPQFRGGREPSWPSLMASTAMTWSGGLAMANVRSVSSAKARILKTSPGRGNGLQAKRLRCHLTGTYTSCLPECHPSAHIGRGTPYVAEVLVSTTQSRMLALCVFSS